MSASDTSGTNPETHWLMTKGSPEQHLWLAVVERAFIDYADFYQYLGGNHNETSKARFERIGTELTFHNRRSILLSLQELERFFFGPPEQWTLHYIVDMCEASDVLMYTIREQVAAKYEQSLKWAKGIGVFSEITDLVEPLKFKTFTQSVYQIDSRLAQHYKVLPPTQSVLEH